jgi:hypothetical protein
MSQVSNLFDSVFDIREEAATDVLANLSRRDVYGVVSSTGEFVTNPVPYSFALSQLKTKYDIIDPPERSPFYNLENVETRLIHTDQRLVKHDKVRNIVLNYASITKPILVARFEEHPFFLVLNGNHRLSSAYLLKQDMVSAYVIDIRVSFL